MFISSDFECASPTNIVNVNNLNINKCDLNYNVKNRDLV